MAPRYQKPQAHHVVGEMLLLAENYTVTHQQVVEHLARHSSLFKGKVSKADINAKVSLYIYKLTGDLGHGGAEIETTKVNGIPVRYRLLTPERLNSRGQVIYHPHQWQSHCIANGLSLDTKMPNFTALAKAREAAQAKGEVIDLNNIAPIGAPIRKSAAKVQNTIIPEPAPVKAIATNKKKISRKALQASAMKPSAKEPLLLEGKVEDSETV